MDGRPIREKARKEYQQILRDLERAREEMERFETHDKPGFDQWLNRHFGALITAIREASQKLQAQRDLLFEIESEAFLSDCSHARAYERVIWRKKHPDAADGTEQAKGTPGQDARGPFDEAFESFFADMGEAFREAAGFPPGNGVPPENPGVAKQVPARLKELYRALVRRLHPDAQKVMTSQRREWWHQVQAAYTSGDVEQLQVILTLCEIEEQGTTANASVSLLVRITRQLKGSLRTLKAQLNKCRRDPAWKFSSLREREPVAASTERMLQAELSELNRALAAVEAQLGGWARQAEAMRRRTPRRRSRAQPEFLF